MLAQAANEVGERLNGFGLFMMIGSIVAVCGMCVYCFTLILRESNPSEHHHAPLDVFSDDD